MNVWNWDEMLDRLLTHAEYRLLDGHLRTLSKPWPRNEYHGGWAICPECGRWEDEPHSDDCAWLNSARACGIA